MSMTDLVKVDVVVTHHPALLEVLRELPGLDLSGARVIAPATPEDVEGRVVVGVLPMRLAALTSRYLELSLDLPPELRGKELTADEVREHLEGLEEYIVIRRGSQQILAVLQGDDLAWVGVSLYKAPQGAARRVLSGAEVENLPYEQLPHGLVRYSMAGLYRRDEGESRP